MDARRFPTRHGRRVGKSLGQRHVHGELRKGVFFRFVSFAPFKRNELALQSETLGLKKLA
jgi:hypothetical protein